MAKAIAVVPVPAYNQQGRKDELLRKLDAAPVEHAEALLALWSLLQAAHEKQVIEVARGAIESSDFIISKLAQAAVNPGAIKGMRNAIMLAEMLGSLNPDVLHTLVKAMPNALHEGRDAAAAARPPSVWASLKRMLGSDSRRAFALVAATFAALGKSLGTKSDT